MFGHEHLPHRHKPVPKPVDTVQSPQSIDGLLQDIQSRMRLAPNDKSLERFVTSLAGILEGYAAGHTGPDDTLKLLITERQSSERVDVSPATRALLQNVPNEFARVIGVSAEKRFTMEQEAHNELYGGNNGS